jgi:hypothetical protein
LNLAQKEKSVQEYTKEFYNISIQPRHEDANQRVSKYVIELTFAIEDDIGLQNSNAPIEILCVEYGQSWHC